LGTNTALTNFNGNAYQFFLNLPFGETMADQKGTMYYQTPYKFNGKEFDEEIGFYCYGARYYEPKISIWLSVDPLAQTSPNTSPYNYCINNPINMIDPDGQKERPNDYDGKMGKGDWRVDDRINGTDVWKNANAYNLQRQKGYKEYNSIEQRAEFYKWFQNQTDSKGFETNWAGAAFVVAAQMSNIHGPFVSFMDNDVEGDIKKFAEAGNKAIFENVFGRLKELNNGLVLKGTAASDWDTKTLTIEREI
jgi:RHS repeat-associated protein